MKKSAAIFLMIVLSIEFFIPGAIRKPDCPIEKIYVKLRGLEPGSSYNILFGDTGEKVSKTGAELMEGLLLESKEKPGSLLISYSKKL